MRKWVKYLFGLVLLLSVSVVAVACGNKKNSSGDGDTPTLLMYQIGDKPKNYDTLIANTNKVLEKKVHAKLKIQYIGWGDYAKKMPVIVSSGENYDIAKADNYAVNAQKGAYTDLTKMMPKYAPKAYKNLDPAYIKGNKVDGKLYSFPVNGNVYAKQVITFNKKYVDKYNLDIDNIKSYDDLEAVFAKFHKANPKIQTFALGQTFRATSDFDYPLTDVYPFAVDVVDGREKIVNQYDSEKMKSIFRTLHKYYQEGYIAKDAATSVTDYPISGNTWLARQETQGPYDYGDSLLTITAGQPLVSKAVTPAIKSAAQAQMCSFVISSSSKHKELAVKVLEEMNTSPEILNGLVYGSEGEAYKYVDDKKRVKLLKGYKEKYHLAAWNTGDNGVITPTENVTDEMIDTRIADTKDAINSPILGFQFKTDKVKTELTNISNVMNKYISGINTGTSDPDKVIPKMDKELKDAGYDKVQKEMQKQYDAFLKENK
ncbi:ABC transporter substrate-binding protein [Companilactobacillus jidongensis]|uniref:ABC transporter substrate-binding protein n=1 Tax=Companilactobacillus jidongensis TaxID=2486006 RepID=UPI000F786883|nr:ABC transporter substrate-binding protein [Companilactobacillus jidongensis]